MDSDCPLPRRRRMGAIVEAPEAPKIATRPAFKMLVSYAHGLERAIEEVETDLPEKDTVKAARAAAAGFLDNIEDMVFQVRQDLFAVLPPAPAWSKAAGATRERTKRQREGRPHIVSLDNRGSGRRPLD